MSKIRTEVTFEEHHGRTLSRRKEHFENGGLFREGLYSKGHGSWNWDIPIGFIKTFNEDGSIKSEEHFDESGTRDGENKFYSKRGVLEKIIIYTNGIIEKETDFKDQEDSKEHK